MKIRISNSYLATPAEWDEAWCNCEYATYFHSREWAEIWQVASSGKMWPAARVVIFSDGQKAVLPFSSREQRAMDQGKEYVSSPEGTYGGWISSSNLSLKHAQLLTGYMLNKCGTVLWRVNPYDPNVFNTGIKPTDRETYRVNLSTGFERVVQGFSDTNIRAIKKARKNGITVKIASTLQDWQEYFKAYEDSLLRWGAKVDDEDRYSWALFREIHDRNSPYVRLWLASYEGKIVSGALCFYAKNNVVYWHGASLKDYFAYRPVNLLFYEIIRNTSQNGYAWFDFNPSHGLPGVIAFKKSFGTESAGCPVIQTGTRIRTRAMLMNKCRFFINKFRAKGNA